MKKKKKGDNLEGDIMAKLIMSLYSNEIRFFIDKIKAVMGEFDDNLILNEYLSKFTDIEKFCSKHIDLELALESFIKDGEDYDGDIISIKK